MMMKFLLETMTCQKIIVNRKIKTLKNRARQVFLFLHNKELTHL